MFVSLQRNEKYPHTVDGRLWDSTDHVPSPREIQIGSRMRLSPEERGKEPQCEVWRQCEEHIPRLSTSQAER